MSFLGRGRGLCGALAIALLLAGCSSAPPPAVAPVPPPFVPPPQEPQCYDESYYVGLYATARQYETAYFDKHDSSDGRKAIDLFQSYLDCAPTGSYSIAANLRKARLHCAMGDAERGRDQLRKLSQHPQAGGSEVINAKYVFDFCDGLVDFHGHPIARGGASPPR